jgi:CheY-like chemotaxis protein
LNLGASDPTPGPTGMTAREPIQRLDGVRVLLVEDELDALDVLADFLREQGAAVFAVPSARRALADLGAAHPDVIVSDIGMPEMDGISLIRSVRRLGGEPAGTPAIALTAFARAEDRDRALEAGYQKYLTKPVELARLARAIAELGPRA